MNDFNSKAKFMMVNFHFNILILFIDLIIINFIIIIKVIAKVLKAKSNLVIIMDFITINAMIMINIKAKEL